MPSISSQTPVTTPLHFHAAGDGVEVIQSQSPPADPAVMKAAEGSARFEAELQELNLRNARLGAWFVMILVPFCSVLDWLAYPEQVWSFLVLRLMCSALCIPLLLSLERSWAGRFHRAYPVILPLLPAMAICLMIYLTGDGNSGYYAGLMLCLVGTSFVFHWTFREIGLTVGLVLACYFAATVPNLHFNGDLRSIGLFINNTLFILLTCVILYFGSRQHHGIRLLEFVNRCKVEAQREELRNRNEELTQTLQRLRETEAQLTQSEKLASIGRLSAGIVHEINNPLNFVKSALFVLKKKSKGMTPELADSVNQILFDIGEGVDRVANIVSDLRTFAHPENKGALPVNLSHAVAKAVRLMNKQVADAKAELLVQMPENCIVLGDDNHIIQILINLIQNSLDAMAGRDDPRVIVSSDLDANGIRLYLRDNGSGIPAEHLQRIFDPFFTTKAVGQGMGLGLSLCYRMMQGMGGRIEAASQLGAYTEFILHFQIPAAAS